MFGTFLKQDFRFRTVLKLKPDLRLKPEGFPTHSPLITVIFDVGISGKPEN
jgi:hypothetical protein